MATINGITFYNPKTSRGTVTRPDGTTYLRGGGEPTPAGWKEPKAPSRKVAAFGSVESGKLVKEQRFDTDLRPANVSKEHWKALGALGTHGKIARGFISMYAQKWHDIQDKGTKDSGTGFYTMDQLKSDKDAITRFFTEHPGGSRDSYNGSYLRSYRDMANNISGEANLGTSAYYDKARKSIAKDKESLGALKSSFGELPNDGFADPKNTRGAYSPVTEGISKGIVNNILRAYPMPE
jgi:hypothetical protein